MLLLDRISFILFWTGHTVEAVLAAAHSEGDPTFASCLLLLQVWWLGFGRFLLLQSSRLGFNLLLLACSGEPMGTFFGLILFIL